MSNSIKFMGYDLLTKKKVTRVISNVVDRIITDEEIIISEVLNTIDTYYVKDLKDCSKEYLNMKKVKLICDDDAEIEIYFTGIAYITNDNGATIDSIKSM